MMDQPVTNTGKTIRLLSSALIHDLPSMTLSYLPIILIQDHVAAGSRSSAFYTPV